MSLNFTFAEAFKHQLETAKPLTESTLETLSTKKCGVTGKSFKMGETVVFVMIPCQEGGYDYKLVAAKAAVLKARKWEYYPLIGRQTPRVVINE